MPVSPLLLSTSVRAGLLATGGAVWILMLGWLLGVEALDPETALGVALRVGALAGGLGLALTSSRGWPVPAALACLAGALAAVHLAPSAELVFPAVMLEIAWRSRAPS